MNNNGPYIVSCQLCRGHAFFEKLEDIPKVFVCLCLTKPKDKTDYKVCGTCNRGSWWNRSTIFRKFECPSCKESKSKKIHIGILPTPQNPIVNRPNVSISLYDLYKKKVEREEAKKKQERIELAELIADRLSKKIQPEVIVNELEDK